MTWDAWYSLYTVLCRVLNRQASGEQARDYFSLLGNVEAEGVERAINDWTREHSKMPTPADLLSLIRARHRAQPAQGPLCTTCHGDKWIPALPFKALGQIVECVKRCPDCGSPPTEYHPHVEQVPLSAVEYQRYLAAKSEPREPVAWPAHIQAIYDRIVARSIA